MGIRRRPGKWLAGVAGVALAAGAVAVISPAATAAPIVAGNVVRDNVDRAHSPQMEAELARGTTRKGAAAAAQVKGIDVASHQHPNDAAINWSQVAGAGNRFVGVKAAEGNYYANPFLAGDQNGARAAGMYAFAYHFAIPNVSGGAAQADYFLDRAGYAPDGKTLNPVLDIEWNPYVDDDHTNSCYGQTPAQLVAWIRTFVDEVKRRTGVPAIIYTAAGWWQSCTGGSAAFAGNPLWVASIAAAPALPAGWSNWTLWQYGQGTVPGIGAAADLNYAAGGEPALAALATKASDPSGYAATAPVRVLDTRNAIGVTTRTPLGAHTSVTLDLSGRLPATATAAVLNVTGIATAATYVTVWPSGALRPNASNLNLVARDIRPNLVTVQVGPDRKVQLYNNSGSTHLLADLAGWYATDAAGLHTARSPQRVLDTRWGVGAPKRPLGSTGRVTLDLSAAVPASATAVTLNLTGAGASRSTFVSAWPTGQTRPNVSNLNIAGANPTSNLVTVALGANRSVDLFNNSGTVNLLADLAGYYAPDAGSRFVALSPMRVLDTRNSATHWVAATGGGSAVALGMLGPVPSGATGAILNLTGVSPSTSTFVTAYPKTTAAPARPGASNLNLVRGQILPNLSSVALGPEADVWLFNNAGTVGLIADLAGYFRP
jgi:GH25 family lysozyme M1 (1,4-beta-N-acetylmuramidase)